MTCGQPFSAPSPRLALFAAFWLRWSYAKTPLLRVFREDVLTCPCGGRRVMLAYLTEPGPVKAILDHLGLPSTGPPLAPALGRDPPSADRRALALRRCPDWTADRARLDAR